jgi:hypothetical protein
MSVVQRRISVSDFNNRNHQPENGFLDTEQNGDLREYALYKICI